MSKKILTVCLVAAGMCAGLSAIADDPQEISKSFVSTPELVNQGKNVFTVNCASCHGNEGKGDGPAGMAFNPRPRNFTAEKFKQGASVSGVFHTVTNGLGSMPSFVSMSVADRLAVTHFVLSLVPAANRDKDAADILAKIGLDAAGKPLAGFKAQQAQELPVEFIIQRMAQDGDIAQLNYKDLERKAAARKEAEKPKPVAAAQPDLERGKVHFQSCMPCHGENGQGTALAQAPQIAGQDVDYLIRTIKKFQTGVRGAHPDDVNGLKMRPMSRMLRTEEDVLSVAHYIAGLTPQKPTPTVTGGDAARGQAAFATCIACHGPDAKGMKAMNAPGLVNLPDWYVINQLHSFKAGYRGTHPQDTTGATMRAMAMTVTDEQAKDIAAYLESLRK